MQINLTKEEKKKRIARLLKNNIKKRKVFLSKIKKKISENK